jgi:hypothetical protein
MVGAEFDTGTARDTFFRINRSAVFRIDGTDWASLCTNPAQDTRITDRNKINCP